jgi:hypothetical protein
MAVAQAYGKTVTSGSVFAYDVADTRNSYIGEPTTNVFTHYGTIGQGSGADNAVNFTIQGTTGFIRLGYGQTFGDYTIKPEDVVYKYDLGGYGCHYHGNSVAIPSGKYATFTFDYYVSPGTTIETNLLANFENYGGSALGGNINAPNSLTGVWQTVTATLGPTGGSGTQAMFLYPGGCGTRFGNTGYILYKNPQVEFLPHKTPFVQTTRSATQGLLPLVGNSTLDLSNVSFDSNAQMVFDGTNDYVDCGAIQPFDLSARNVTWEAVVKFNNTSGAEAIMTRWNNSTGEVWWFGRYDTTKIHVAFIIGGDGYGYYSDGNIGTSAGYYHVAVTLNNTVLSYYINGVLDSTDTVAAGTWTSDPDPNLLIGAQNQGAASNLNGEIPVAKIYNRALSASEVKQNFDFYNARFAIEYDTYYFTVSNRAARVCRRHWDGSGFYTFRGKNMAATTPAYILYSKPNASNGIVANYTEIARNDIGTPARPTVFGPQTEYSNGRYLTDVIVYKGKRGGPLRFEFPNGGTSQYGENFYKSIITPYVS